jgi:hypothetical protein
MLPRLSSRLRLPLRLLHLAVLWWFAAAQPLYDLVSDQPEFLADEDATGFAFVVFGLVLGLLVPLVLGAVEVALTALRPRLGYAFHLGAVGLLGALWMLQVRVPLGLELSDTAAVSLAMVVGAAVAVLYARAAPARTFLTVLAPVPFVFLAVFLLTSPAADVLRASGPTPRHASPASRTPIVFVVFDEFPVNTILDGRRQIDAARYPGFAQLARRGTWFRDTATVDTDTPYAVPAILTATYPREGRRAFYARQPRSLLSLFHGPGPRPRVREHVTHLCPPTTCHRDRAAVPGAIGAVNSLFPTLSRRLLPEGLADRAVSLRDRIGSNRGDPVEGRLPRAFRDRAGQFRAFLGDLDALAEGPRGPPLVYVHALLPHFPWTYLPSGARRAPTIAGTELVGLAWPADRARVARSWREHLLQTQFVDTRVRALLDRLDRLGVADDVVLVVTADHGVSFRAPGGVRSTDREDLDATARVPFFLMAPRGARGRVVNQPVETVDVLPTALAAAGVRLPWRVDGRSALGAGPPRAPVLRLTERGKAPRRISRRWLSAQHASLDRQLSLFGSGTPLE